jgi:hypothetical protein
MDLEVVTKCPCGFMMLNGLCPHCDTTDCPFCAGFSYDKCMRNKEYNETVNVREGYNDWFPLRGGIMSPA